MISHECLRAGCHSSRSLWVRWAVRVAAAGLLLWVAACAAPRGAGGGGVVGQARHLPPLPLLAPTALTGDAGDGRAYLRWNPQIEEPRVAGWQVLEIAPQSRVRSPVLHEPACVVRNLANGTSYTFVVVGVLGGRGARTPHSNPAQVTPALVGTSRIERVQGGKPGRARATALAVSQHALRLVFPDGQELVYDVFRPVDWTGADGTHLLYSGQFGNGLDIGRFDARGLPMVIPPDGLDRTPPYASADGHAPFEPLNPDYRDAQHGTRHPHLTDPLTLPASGRSNDARSQLLGTAVDGNRVTLHYTLPMTLMGYRSWTQVEVWETWWPLTRDRHGTRYQGLARLVEVCMPSVVKEGFQVMLNNGFGPAGSREGVVSYSTGFREPGAEVVDFSGPTNRQVCFQGAIPARQGYGYHPNGNSLQASPLIFYDWGLGSLTITARSLYYHCANNSASYAEQGVDGVWPNLAWDLAESGRRTAVDTVEYLYTSDMRLPLPQRFLTARFEAYGDVSRRMGLQDGIGAVGLSTPHSQIARLGGPEAAADTWVRDLAGKGVDVVGMYHDTWQANPDVVDAVWLTREDHGANPAFARMNAKLRAAGLHPGFWFRPEFCKTSLPTALGTPVLPRESYYHSIDWMTYPLPEDTLVATERAVPVIRDHPEWIRRQRDGAWPRGTPYQWIPMSLASGWWDEIMWPALNMSARLGYDRVLTDGGFGGLQGVDYAPMLAGMSDTAVPCQPFWWRYFRTLHHLGIRQMGECTGGWVGANTSVGGPTDAYNLWMFQMGSIVFGDALLKTPEAVHQAFQLYNGCWGSLPAEAVRKFAVEFYRQHPAPEWIELKDLRQGEAVEVVATKGRFGGLAAAASPESPHTYTVRPWTWGDAVWHYADGSQAIYPAYVSVDWPAAGR